MKSWMRSVLEFVGACEPHRKSTPTRVRKDRSRKFSAVESLERREVMSGAGVPLVTVPAAVTTGGGVAHVVVHFDAGQLASDRSQSILLGFYAKPVAGSTLAPNITEVDAGAGRLTRASLPQRGTANDAKALFITSVPLGTGGPQDVTVNVSGLNGKTGTFDLEAFLPGDVNGDSVVNATDLTLIQAAYGSSSKQANFNPAADFNADGHVGCVDRFLADLNQGAHAVYNPAPVVVPAVAPQAAPVVTTQTVTTTPVVTTQAVAATPVVLASVQPTATVASVQATPVVVAPLQATPTATPVYTQANASVPIYAVPTGQAAIPTYAQAPTGYVPSATATPVYYSGQSVVPAGTVSLTNQAQMPGVAYYYGQPVVQAPGYSQPVSNQATVPGAVYYYGQPVVQAPGYNATATPNVVYYYGQPTAQVTTTSQTAQS